MAASEEAHDGRPPWRKLGYLLVTDGLLGVDQLMDALETQLVSGGRLGTVLVHMEVLQLDQISRYLSIQHRVPEAVPAMLEAASAEALAVLNRDFCRQHEICPLQVHGARLHLAMTTPTPELVDEITYHLDREVVPFVVPELRLHYYLERHYAVKRTARFLRVAAPHERPEERRGYVQVSIEGDAAEPDAPAREPRISGRIRLGGVFGADPTPAPVEPRVTETAAPPRPAVIEALEGAHTGRAIARALVRHGIEEAATTVLLWVRERVAIGSQASGTSVTEQQLGRLVVSLETPSLLRQAVETTSVIHALADRFDVQRRVAGFLGLHEPGEVLVAPVVLRGKVVCLLMLFARAATSFAEGAAEQVADIARAASRAYRRIARTNLDRDQSIELLRLEVEHLREELRQTQKARDGLMQQVFALTAAPRDTARGSGKTFKYVLVAVILMGMLLIATISLSDYVKIFAPEPEQPPTIYLRDRPRAP